ncbi:MAG TPA: hypothetical protein VHQ98_01585 [Gaiellaceae bacterium]|jgi:hypothetical protein|nr:hypothetical protein [Gaiellaceae bacterium]
MKTSWQAVTVIAVAVAAICLVTIAAFHWLPGAIPKGKTDNTSSAISAITGAALTAIASAVSAFFGIRAASNAADKASDTAGAAQQQNRLQAAQLAEVSGVGNKEDVKDALARGAESARRMT